VSANVLPTFNENQKKVDGKFTCVICEYAVSYIETRLQQNQTEEAIIDTLEKVCTVAPAKFQQECQGIIENYGPLIIQLLLQFADPNAVCGIIKLC
jgi:saposin